MSFWRVVEGRLGGVAVDEIHAKAFIESLNERETTKQEIPMQQKKEVSDDEMPWLIDWL